MAEERTQIDPTKCVICQQSLGRHSMKVKMDRRVRRICNRVDQEHAEWLLDHNMELNYLRITHRRRGGILGIIVLVLSFLALIWLFVYSTDFKAMFVVVAGILSALVGIFVVMEFLTITVADRMRVLIRDVEMERPVVSPEPHPSLERLDEVAALAGEAEPERGRVAIHAEPAPAQTAAPRPSATLEDGIPGMPQPVVADHEWQVMGVEEPAPVPAQAQAPPGIPPPPVPPPMVEELPDEVEPPTAQPLAPSMAPEPKPPAPPISPSPPQAVTSAPPPPPPAPVQQAPPPPPPVQQAPPPPAPVQQAPPPPPPVQQAPPPPPPVQQAPQAPPPAMAPQVPHAPLTPSQPPPPPVQATRQPPAPPAQAAPAPPAPPAQYAPPGQQPPQKRPQAQVEEVEEAEWVDWE